MTKSRSRNGKPPDRGGTTRIGRSGAAGCEKAVKAAHGRAINARSETGLVADPTRTDLISKGRRAHGNTDSEVGCCAGHSRGLMIRSAAVSTPNQPLARLKSNKNMDRLSRVTPPRPDRPWNVTTLRLTSSTLTHIPSDFQI